MKKFFIYGLIAGSLFSTTAFSQEKEFVIPKNDDVTLDVYENTKVVATDVYSMRSKLKRNVKVVDERTHAVLGDIFISLESSNPDIDLYQQLENEPEKFTGELKIETD